MKRLTYIALAILFIFSSGCSSSNSAIPPGPAETVVTPTPTPTPLPEPTPSPTRFPYPWEIGVTPNLVAISGDTLETWFYKRGVGTISGTVLTEENNTFESINNRFLELENTGNFSYAARAATMYIQFMGEVPQAMTCYDCTFWTNLGSSYTGPEYTGYGEYPVEYADDYGQWPAFAVDLDYFKRRYPSSSSDTRQEYRTREYIRIVCEYEDVMVEYLLISNLKPSEGLITITNGLADVWSSSEISYGSLLTSDDMNEFSSIQKRFEERLKTDGFYNQSLGGCGQELEFGGESPKAVEYYIYNITPDGEFLQSEPGDREAREGAVSRVLDVSSLTPFKRLELEDVVEFLTEHPDDTHRGLRIVCEYENTAVEYLFLHL